MGIPKYITDFLHRRHLPILLVFWWVIHFLVPFDRKFSSSLHNVGVLVVLFGAYALAWENRAPINRKAVWRWGIGYALLAGIGFLRVSLTEHVSDSGGFFEAARSLFSERPRHSRELVEAPLLAMLSVLIWLKTREKARAVGQWEGAYRQFATIFPLLSVIFYASALLSNEPAQSLPLFAREGGLYLPLAQLLFLHTRAESGIRPWLRPLWVFGLVFSIAAALVFLMGAAGAESARVWMEGKSWIRWEIGPLDTDQWRVQFPFKHHNRMASYFLLAIFMTPALFGQSKSRRALLFEVLALLPLFAILVSKTRGAYVALALGLVVMFLAAGHRRKVWPWGILLVGCLGVFLMPGVRQHALSMFRAETYTRPGDTLYLRYAGWRAGFAMIADHPFLGIGYGSKTFSTVYRKEYQERYQDPETKPHAHNNFIELAAESGLAALGLFLWLNGLIAWKLWKKRETGDCWRPALLGLLAAIHVYGMANYNLRQGIGFVLWGLLALLARDALDAPASSDKTSS